MMGIKSAPGILGKANFIPENLLGRQLGDLSFQYLILVLSLIFLFYFLEKAFHISCFAFSLVIFFLSSQHYSSTCYILDFVSLPPPPQPI